MNPLAVAALLGVLQSSVAALFIFALIFAKSFHADLHSFLLSLLIFEWLVVLCYSAYRYLSYRRSKHLYEKGASKWTAIVHGVLSVFTLLWMSCYILHADTGASAHTHSGEEEVLIVLWILVFVSGLILLVKRVSRSVSS